jgi:hypothetical protein
VIRPAIVAVLLGLAVAACGSGSSGPASVPATSATPTVATDTPAVARARIEAAQCFRAHGIDIPDFTPGGGRIRAVLRIIASYPTVKVQSVSGACMASLRQAFPNAFGTDLTPSQLAERRQEALAFAQCMRAHGIAFPDPTAVGGNPAAALGALSSLDTSSPAFKAAATNCQAQTLKAAAG